MKLDRLLRIAAVAAAALLMTLLVQHQSQERERRWLDAFANQLSSYTVADLQLRHELMKARVGVSNRFERLDAAVTATEEAARALASLASRDETFAKAASILSDRVWQRHEAVEQFKANSARLQSAMIEMAVLGRAGSPTGRRSLFADVLRLSIDTSREAVESARRSVERSALEHDPAAGSARDVVRILPIIDVTMRQVESEAIDDDLRRIIVVVQRHGAELEIQRMRHGAFAGLAMAFLVASVMALIWRSKVRARWRREQGEAVQLSARVAEVLLADEASNSDARYRGALREVARMMDARRVVLAVQGSDGLAIKAWPGPADDDPERAATALACRHSADGHDVPVQDGMLVLNHREWPDLAMIVEISDRSPSVKNRGNLRGLAALSTFGKALEADRAHAARIALERRLAQAERLEVVGTIASGVAHNFNNIVGAISGFAEMAKERARPGSAVAGYMDEIGSSVDRARALIDEIMNLARSGQRTIGRVPIDRLVLEAVALVKAARSDGERLVIGAVDGSTTLGNEARLQQVIVNIVNNALIAGDAGEVVVRSETRTLSSAMVASHGRLPAGNWCVVSIADEGPGITPSTMTRLFEPFFTTRACGNGLGLSTARQIVSDHQGTINVVQPDRGGSVFEVWLPVGGGARLAGGERIGLIVEGNDADDYEDMLAKLGFEPVQFDENAGWESIDALMAVVQTTASRPRIIDLRPSSLPIVIVAGPDQMDRWRDVATAFTPLPLEEHGLASALTLALLSRQPPTLRG